jgi:cytochrome c6
MPRTLLFVFLVILCTSTVFNGCRKEAAPDVPRGVAPSVIAGQTVPPGEALFKQYCSSCHPDGGNVSDPERTLRGSVLKKNHVTSADDIIRIMRHPVSRMIRFDVSTLSDRDARAIAEYILTTFK